MSQEIIDLGGGMSSQVQLVPFKNGKFVKKRVSKAGNTQYNLRAEQRDEGSLGFNGMETNSRYCNMLLSVSKEKALAVQNSRLAKENPKGFDLSLLFPRTPKIKLLQVLSESKFYEDQKPMSYGNTLDNDLRGKDRLSIDGNPIYEKVFLLRSTTWEKVEEQEDKILKMLETKDILPCRILNMATHLSMIAEGVEIEEDEF